MKVSIQHAKKAFRARRKQIEESARKTIVEVAKSVATRLAWETPVDTSKALSNWRASRRSPITSEINPYFPGKAGSTFEASARAATSKAWATYDSKKQGEPLFLANNVEYIEKLNSGWSVQQPDPNYVERIVDFERDAMLKSYKLR